jgi:uncharacterized protein (DUF2141 family)
MVQKLNRLIGRADFRTLFFLSVFTALVTISWAFAQFTDESNTVNSYEELVADYLAYRENSYMLAVPSWYLLDDQAEAIESTYGLAGFQNQPDWYFNFNVGEIYYSTNSPLAGLVTHGTKLIIYEDMISGELLVVSDTGTNVVEEIVFKSPDWPDMGKDETPAYLLRELSKRRVVWHVTLKDAELAEEEFAAMLAAQEEEFEGGGMMMLMGGGSCTQIVFTGIEKLETNDWVDVGFCIPDGITNIDIFVSTNLLPEGFPWTLAAENLPVESNSVVWSWTDLEQTNVNFAAGDGTQDTDGDGLTDAREFYLSGTEMNDWDTDGDGVSDGDEWANGSNPNNPNDPPNVSGTINYYGLQTNMIRVLAVTDSDAWFLTYSATLTTTGSYQIADLPPTNYYIKAYRDLNGNGFLDAEDAFGVYSNNPVSVTGQVQGIDILLTEPDSDGDGVSDYTERTVFRTDPNNPADIPPQLTRASSLCYFGYGAANTNWHYKEGASGLSKFYSVGTGWVTNNMFLPDLSTSQDLIYYGEALGNFGHASGGWIYATTISLDHDVSMSSGWIWGGGYLTDYRQPSQTIRYFQPNPDDFPDLFVFTKSTTVSLGKDDVGIGWTRPGSFTADLSFTFSTIYQGLVKAHQYSTNFTSRHTLPASKTSDYKKGNLGFGWATAAGFVPRTTTVQHYYYGTYKDTPGVAGYSTSSLDYDFGTYLTLGYGYLAGNNFIPNPATAGGPPIGSYDQDGDGFVDIPKASEDQFARVDDSAYLELDVTVGDASGSHTELYGYDIDDLSFDMPYVNENEYLFSATVPLERGQTFSGTLRSLPDDDDDGDYTFLLSGGLQGPSTNLSYSGQTEAGIVVQAGFPHSNSQDTNIFGYVNDSGFNSGTKPFTIYVPLVNIRAHSAGTLTSNGTEVTSFHEYLPNAILLPATTGAPPSVITTNFVNLSALLIEKFLPSDLDEGTLQLTISDTNVLALYDHNNNRLMPTTYDLDDGPSTNPLYSVTLFDRTFHALGLNPGAAAVTLRYIGSNGVAVCSDTIQFRILTVFDHSKVNTRNLTHEDDDFPSYDHCVALPWNSSRTVDLTTYLTPDSVTYLSGFEWYVNNNEQPSASYNYGSQPGVNEITVLQVEVKAKSTTAVFDRIIVTVVPISTVQDYDAWFLQWSANTGWLAELPATYSSLAGGTGDPEPGACTNQLWENTVGNVNYYHPGATFELRSEETSGGHGHQACYTNGGAFISSGVAAGSADRSHYSNLIPFSTSHRILDVLPFVSAAQLDGNPVSANDLFPTNLDRPMMYEGVRLQQYLQVRPAVANNKSPLTAGICGP